MNIDDWCAQVVAALDLPADALDRNAILDLARDAAHNVARPAAPLTAYLVGVAVGQGSTLTDALGKIRGMLPEAAE